MVEGIKIDITDSNQLEHKAMKMMVFFVGKLVQSSHLYGAKVVPKQTQQL